MSNPIKDKLENQRQQLATFIKLLEKYSEDSHTVEVIVKFKHKRFNNEERTTKITTDKHSLLPLDPMLKAIMDVSENMFLNAIQLLKEINSKEDHDATIC